MKALIVYDSQFGNTERVARAMAEALDGTAVRVGQANAATVMDHELLIVGSPTQGGRPTPAVKQFVNSLPTDALSNVGVAAFDTRVPAGGLLKVLLGVIGYAAAKIAASLRARGGRLAAPPEGFLVKGKEGPLLEGELERAVAWANKLARRGTAART